MPNPAVTLHLLTLGRFALVDAEGSVVVSTDSAKPLALLCYLAASPGRRATRDRLIDLFWADSSIDKARSSLRQSLYKLRELLGDVAIRSDSGGDVWLQSGLHVDRDAFLAALDAGDLATALACYGGPFAPGVVSAGSAGFEHWADHERERLHDLFAAAADTMARRLIAAGNPREADALAQRLLDTDPLDETAWRLRLEAEVASGTRVHLAASIGELQRRLHEAGRDPEPRTRDLLQSLSRPAAPGFDAPAGPSLMADLIGRQAEFTTLYNTWRATIHGRGTHIHIIGIAGLGKTRLLEDLATRLSTECAWVVTVRATPRQRAVPASVLGTIVAALAQLPGATGISPESTGILVDLQPAISARFRSTTQVAFGDPVDRDRVRTEALCDLISAVTEERPLALLLDDLHWWDQNSRTMLANVIERVADHHILFVTTSRPGNAELHTDASRNTIELAPLDRAAIRELVLSLGDCDDPAAFDHLVAGLHRASAGVPLLVLEALRLGLDRGWLDLDRGQWTFADLVLFLDELQPESMLHERLRVLSSAQHDLLLIAALAERPIDAITAARPDGHGSADDLTELERHGMLRALPTGWVIAHDTIAEHVIGVASPEEQRAAHQWLAEIQLTGNPDAAALRLAMEHLCEAGDASRQRAVALVWLSRRRAEGDERPIGVLLDELVGPFCDAARRRELQASLPGSIRHPRRFRRTALAAVALIALLAAGVAWWRNQAPPDAELALIDVGADHVTTEQDLPLRLGDWEGTRGQAPLAFGRVHTAAWQIATDSLSGYPIPDPSGRYWAFSRRIGGSNNTELFVRGSDGDHIVAPAAGDNVEPSWAPDGSAIVFMTTRYPDGGGTFDLAVADVRTAKVRRLTATRDGEWSPKWSPDGLRIAFIRKPEVLGRDRLCWVTVDASVERCLAFPALEVQGLVGWTDARSVLLLTSGPGDGHLELRSVDLHDSSDRLVLADDIERADLSPDGHWVVASTRLADASRNQRRLIAFAIDHPSRVRSVVQSGASDWSTSWRPGSRTPSLATVFIRPDRDSIFVPGPVQLSAEGRSASGDPVEIPEETLHWTSSDPDVASIDDAGRLEPRRDGVVTITVSVGGWRSASVRRTIVSGKVSEVLHETWSSDWLTRWTRYGDPLPLLVKAADGTPAMLVNGDSTYTSGAYSTYQYDASHGLAIDVQLKTPITRSWWQNLTVALAALTPVVGVDGNRSGDGCSFKYPATEGGNGIRVAGIDRGSVAVEPTLATGRWFRLRIQLFPDGTCGVALDGHLLFHGTTHHSSTAKYSVRLDGQTYRSLLLVGPLTVWQGVPAGVNWSEH